MLPLHTTAIRYGAVALFDQAQALELAATYQGIVQNLPDHARAIGS